jgi:hypothetical protein
MTKSYMNSFWMILFWLYWISKKKLILVLNFLTTSMHFLSRYFICRSFQIKIDSCMFVFNFFFHASFFHASLIHASFVFSLTIYWTSIGLGCIFSIQVGTNRTFYFQGVKKTTLAVDLVIADISEGLSVSGISSPPFIIPFCNTKSDKFMFVLFSHFACNIVTMMVLYWYFILKIQSGRKNYLHILSIIISRLVMNLGLVWTHFV